MYLDFPYKKGNCKFFVKDGKHICFVDKNFIYGYLNNYVQRKIR